MKGFSNFLSRLSDVLSYLEPVHRHLRREQTSHSHSRRLDGTFIVRRDMKTDCRFIDVAERHSPTSLMMQIQCGSLS
jgi:hypothetical protein